MDKATKEKLKTFAEGYIASAQNYEGIDDEWVDYMGFCLNLYDNGERLSVSVYPIIEYEKRGKKYLTQDVNNCLCENLLEA